MSLSAVLAVVFGIAALVGGAELLVRGATAIAARFGVEPIVIGLTVVAFGTSAPELAISVASAVDGETELALGNVVGSNIANVLFILGASSAVSALVVAQRVVRLDVPIVIGVSLLVAALAVDGRLGRLESAALVVGVLAHTVWLIRRSRRESAAVRIAYELSLEESFEQLEVAAERPLWWKLTLVVVGLAGLTLGGRWMVSGATDVAAALGVSDLMIGVTVVAIGTSLPELATSLLAVLRGQRDLAVGNVVGSNLFNLLLVLGMTGVVSPGGVPVSTEALSLDIPVMLASTIVLVPILWNGFVISRWEGLLLLASYVTYLTYLVLDAAAHGAAAAFGLTALLAAPVTVMVLIVLGYRGWRRQRTESPP